MHVHNISLVLNNCEYIQTPWYVSVENILENNWRFLCPLYNFPLPHLKEEVSGTLLQTLFEEEFFMLSFYFSPFRAYNNWRVVNLCLNICKGLVCSRNFWRSFLWPHSTCVTNILVHLYEPIISIDWICSIHISSVLKFCRGSKGG